MSRKMSLTGGVLAGGLIAASIFAPAVHADVKTKEKTQVKVEGLIGRIVGGPKDGLTNTVAVKGNRMATFNDQNGMIVDLSEEKIYQVDVKKKEYKAITFAAMRAQMEKARADMEKQMKDMPPEARGDMQQATANIEVTFDVKPGAENKSIAGHQARHMVVTVTAKEKGKTIEESGGMVLTNDVWLGPRIAALNEVAEFNLKYAKAVYGDSFAGMAQQMAGLSAMFPGLMEMMKTMGEQTRKLEGTSLMTVMRFETVKSAAAMSQAQSQPSGGGGLGGALARKMMGNKGKPEQRSLLFTSTNETLSIDTTAADADVAIPADFKEKK
jgi:hypothetical protein